MNKAILILTALIVTHQSASAVRQPATKRLVLTDCQPQGIKGRAKRGSFEVYENGNDTACVKTIRRKGFALNFE